MSIVFWMSMCGLSPLGLRHDGSFAHPDVYHFLLSYHLRSVSWSGQVKFEVVGTDRAFGLFQQEDDELHACCQASVPPACPLHEEERDSSLPSDKGNVLCNLSCALKGALTDRGITILASTLEMCRFLSLIFQNFLRSRLRSLLVSGHLAMGTHPHLADHMFS